MNAEHGEENAQVKAHAQMSGLNLSEGIWCG